MEKKQSSIDYLFERFYANEGMIKTKQLEQAKAMHKEEIVKACNLQRNDYKGMPTFNKNGEEYYNKTYGGNK